MKALGLIRFKAFHAAMYFVICASFAYGQLAYVSGPVIPEEHWVRVGPKDREVIETLIAGEADNKRTLESMRNVVMDGWYKSDHKPEGSNSTVMEISVSRDFSIYRDLSKIRYDRQITKQGPTTRIDERPARSAYDGAANLYVREGVAAYMRPLNRYGLAANFGDAFSTGCANPLRSKGTFAHAIADMLDNGAKQGEHGKYRDVVSTTFGEQNGVGTVTVTVLRSSDTEPVTVMHSWTLVPDQGCQIVRFCFEVSSDGRLERRYESRREMLAVQENGGYQAWIIGSAEADDHDYGRPDEHGEGMRVSHESFRIETVRFEESLPEDTFSLRGMGAVGIPIYDLFTGEPQRFDSEMITNEVIADVLAEMELELEETDEEPWRSTDGETSEESETFKEDDRTASGRNVTLLVIVGVAAALLAALLAAGMFLARRRS